MKMNRKWTGALKTIMEMVCLFLMFALQTQGGEKELFRIAGIISTKSTYWSEMIKGIEDGCAQWEMSFFVLDISLQDRDALSFSAEEAWNLALLSDVDAIIADGNLPDDEIVKKARDQGIVIVLVDSDSEKYLRDAYVGTDNVQAGRLAVQALKEICGVKKGPVMVQDNANIQAVSQRVQGISQALSENYPDVYMRDAQIPWYADRTFNSGLEETILSYPDLQAIFGLMEPEATVYAQVLKQLHLEDTIQLISFDLSDEIVEFLREDVIDAVIVQQSYEIGYQSARTANQLLKGEKLEQDTVYIDCLILHKNNLSLIEKREGGA